MQRGDRNDRSETTRVHLIKLLNVILMATVVMKTPVISPSLLADGTLSHTCT
jgi:hypothetical protein